MYNLDNEMLNFIKVAKKMATEKFLLGRVCTIV